MRLKSVRHILLILTESDCVSSSNLITESSTAFDAVERTIGELTLCEVSNRAMISMAFAPAARDAVNSLCLSKLGASLPAVGGVSRAGDGLTLLGLQYDQIWCIQEQSDRSDEKSFIAQLGHPDSLYLTDHGDGWATLALEGKTVLAVLERLCPLDLNTYNFPVNSVSRTALEHMGAVIVRTGDFAFEIMTPRSYASSLLHAVENVALHIHHEGQL